MESCVALEEHRDSLLEGGCHLKSTKCEGTRLKKEKETHQDLKINKYLVQVFQIKARNAVFKNGIALSEFLFKMFGVTVKSECLAVPPLLMAGSARCCAGGASWVFRIAL